MNESKNNKSVNELRKEIDELVKNLRALKIEGNDISKNVKKNTKKSNISSSNTRKIFEIFMEKERKS